MSDIHIREAEPKDVREMQDIFYHTWLATYPNDEIGVTEEDVHEQFKHRFSEENLKTRVQQIADLQKDKTGIALIAEDGDRIVGQCIAFIREEYNQLQAIYILPEYQGRGIGTKLWRQLQDFFDPHKDIIVQTATYNTDAIAFYKKLGFIDTGKRFEQERHRMPISGVFIPEMELILRKSKNA